MKRVLRNVLSITIALIMVFSVLPFAARINVKAESSDNPAAGHNVGDIIEFGSYPQSLVKDTALKMALDLEAGPSFGWTDSYGYYTGSGIGPDGQMKPSNYMRYKDIWHVGTMSMYRAVYFSQYRPYGTDYTSSYANSYQDDNGYTPNNVYYFKFEPLRWRILDPGEGLVMCENIIDSQAYNNYVLYANGEYWGDSEMTYYSSNWEKSSLRQWLNDNFYNTAFSSTEKNVIKTSYLENKSTYLSTYDAPSTYDKIFLLSYWDAINSEYGFSSSYSTSDTARIAQGSDYAKCQGLKVYRSPNDGNSNWRLRSPRRSFSTRFVYGGGLVYDDFGYDTCDTIGVRPVLKFNPKSSIDFNGSKSTGSASGQKALAMDRIKTP